MNNGTHNGDDIKCTIDGVEYALERITKYMHFRIQAMIADSASDNGEVKYEAVARAAYKYLPYIITQAPNMPARVKCDIDGVPCRRIDPLWVAEHIDGFAAIQLLYTALQAATPSEDEVKN